MTLDKMMMNMQTKQAIDLGCGEGQLDEDVGSRLSKYKACQANRISLDKYDKAE